MNSDLLKENKDSQDCYNLNKSNTQPISYTKKTYKNILSKISKGSLEINNIVSKKCEENNFNGWIYFSVNMKNIGLNQFDFKQKDNEKILGKEIFSNYMVDFIGELLVRSNIEQFMPIFLNIENYLELINKEKHKRFGATLNLEGKKIIFCFHISLLQNILTEDFKYSL